MTRRIVTFLCEGSTLVGTLDEAAGRTGLLIVSGGNEIRCGAWGGQALLAARVAAQGHPVFRFDRRGVGDSEGGNGGYRTGGPDLTAALQAFRAQAPDVTRIVGLGNCDAASTLMLGGGAGFDGLILANPWTLDDADPDSDADHLRTHYVRRLTNPAALARLAGGGVSLGQLLRSVRAALGRSRENHAAQELRRGIAGYAGSVSLLLAERDRTAQAFRPGWGRAAPQPRICVGATHSFVEADARRWFEQQVLAALAAVDGIGASREAD